MNKVVTIGRQYGSGGREIGQKIAEYYNIPFYPVVKGIRGTTKTPYQQNMELEKKVYQGLSRFNLFNVNWIYPIIFSLYDEKSRKGGKWDDCS